MAFNYFDLAAHSTASHCAEVSLTFLVLIGFAVFIDMVLRWAKQHGKASAGLLTILHVAATVLVLTDLAFIFIDVGQALAQRLF